MHSFSIWARITANMVHSSIHPYSFVTCVAIQNFYHIDLLSAFAFSSSLNHWKNFLHCLLFTSTLCWLQIYLVYIPIHLLNSSISKIRYLFVFANLILFPMFRIHLIPFLQFPLSYDFNSSLSPVLARILFKYLGFFCALGGEKSYDLPSFLSFQTLGRLEER